MRRLSQCIRIAAVAALLLVPATIPNPVHAATFTVNSFNDEPDSSPGDGNCRGTLSGQCTLRAAIMEANALPGNDTITLPSGTFKLTKSGHDDTAAEGDLDITSSIGIRGAGPTSTIVDASALTQRDRVFDVRPYSWLHLRDLRVTGGHARSRTTIGGEDGGGIRVMDWAQVDLAKVAVAGNQAESVGGGMTLRSNAIAQLSAVTFDNNRAALDGGGISTHDGVLLDLRQSTISRNRAGRDGGGIRYIGHFLGISNSTISTNTASGRGGGIFFDQRQTNYFYGEYLTLAYNVASTAGSGANIFLTYAQGTRPWQIHKSIVRGGVQGNCGGQPLTSGGFNLEDTNTCGFTAAGDMVNTNPQIGLLGLDNSTTEVHPLKSNSPAVNAIPNCGGFNYDQRSVSRPQGGACDIGAYELDNR